MSLDTECCRVLILGASFTGIEVLYQLRQSPLGRILEVIVVDMQDSHPYLPLVHERMCQRISGAELASAKSIDADPHARFVCGEISEFDPEIRTATLRDGRRIQGDMVVVALGSVSSPDPSLRGSARLFSDKSAAQVVGLAEALERQLTVIDDPISPRIAVIGGGISGVEIAGELAHLRKSRPDGWRWPEVTLLHGGDRLLPSLSRSAGKRAASLLLRQGVDLRLDTRVLEVHAQGLTAQQGSDTIELACAFAIWAGGVTPAPVLSALNLPLVERGWLRVGPTLQCFPLATDDRALIFAGGDAVRIVGGDGEWPTMQRAIECIWQAQSIAENLLQLVTGAPEDAELKPHKLHRDFFHGVSVGAHSLVVRGPWVFDGGPLTLWFRRWLMDQYFARYGHRRSPPG